MGSDREPPAGGVVSRSGSRVQILGLVWMIVDIIKRGAGDFDDDVKPLS